MNCPFKVGDRIHKLRALPTYNSSLAGALGLTTWEDDSRPDATVTALTACGFEYRYDKPIQFVRPDWGTTDGGEVFEEGFHMWRKVDWS